MNYFCMDCEVYIDFDDVDTLYDDLPEFVWPGMEPENLTHRNCGGLVKTAYRRVTARM